MYKITRYVLVIALVTGCTTALAMKMTWDYRIKLTKNTGGLEIAVRTFVGPAVAVGLENHSNKAALCSASFVSYPHSPSLDETRSATVAPGKKATLAYPAEKLGGEFSTAFVDVKCAEKKPAD